MSSFFKKLSKALPATADAYFKGVEQNENWQNASQKRALLAQQALQEKNKQLMDAQNSGFTIDENGNTRIDPSFYDQNSENHKRMAQVQLFKRMGEAGKDNQPNMTPEQLDYISRGDFAGLAKKYPNLQVPSGYANFRTKDSAQNTFLADDYFAGLNKPVPPALKGKQIPISVLPNFKPASAAQTPGNAPASPAQMQDYQKKTGADPTGLTQGQYSDWVKVYGTQMAVGDRQDKTLSMQENLANKRLEAIAKNQDRQQKNSDRSYGLQVQKYETEKNQLPQSVADRVTKNNDFVNSLKQVREAVKNGTLQVGGAKGVAKSYGLGTGSVGGALGGLAGISPEEAAVLNVWNQSVIDQVIENAATTFSDRFVQTQKSALPSLSSNKASFLRSIDDVIAKEENFAKNLVGKSLAAKGGKPQELLKQSPSPYKEQQPGQRRVVKKQYSQRRNQTKIIYSDGKEDIVNGKQ